MVQEPEQTTDAAAARRHAEQGDLAIQQGRFESSVASFIEAARLEPSNADYHYKLAMAAWRTRHAELIEPHLLRALLLQPDQPILHEAVGEWYLTMGKIGAALTHARRALALEPGSPEYAISYAMVLHQAGQTEQAGQMINPLLASGYCSCRLALLQAQLARGMDQLQEALRSIECAERTDCEAGQRVALCFTAAELLDRLGRYDEAFERARQANALASGPYDPQRYRQWVDWQIAYFTPAQLYSMPRASKSSRRPVFIVGMPRSGTSLVEQILACHSQVHGGGELDALSVLAVRAGEGHPAPLRNYPELLEGISLRQANELAASYLATIDSLNASTAYVTDKMPLNFFYLGLIAILFPDAHIIHCSRDPRDTCVSCYFTNFMFAHEFSMDLHNLGLFYGDYQRLVRHWRYELNYPLLEVKYEEMVEDIEGQTRRMLEYLDLPWEPACLDFHRSRRHVATASREQVRRPIYRSSVGRWRKYERHLGDLFEALGSYDSQGQVANSGPA